MHARGVVLLVGVLGAVSFAARAQPVGQGGWLIEVFGGPVSPSNPTVTIRVSAYFPTNLFGFGGGDFDVEMNDASGHFSDVIIPAPLGPKSPPVSFGCFGFFVGGTYPDRIDDVEFIQINIAGCIAHPANPLPILEAKWTTTDFSKRVVDLWTSDTSVFSAYSQYFLAAPDVLLYPSNFEHGSAQFQVIPAPPAALFVLGCALTALRCRR
jgi:hypothetical protein